MAIMSLKEFGDSMGMPYDTVKKNAQRGKIIKGTDGKIDTDNPINKLFFDTQIALSGTKKTKSEPKEVVKRDNKKVPTEKPTGLTANQKIYADVDFRTREATAQVKERESELKRIQLEKLAGNILPTDFVERCFTINIQAIFKNFDAALENLSMIYVEEMGGSRSDVSRLTNRLREELSIIIEKSKKDGNYEIQEELKSVVENRTQGQRK